MATKIILYIGANNKTGRITKEYEEKVEVILRKYWDGFTLKKCKGCYQGVIEESMEAVMITLRLVWKNLHDCVEELKVKLIQDTIGVEITANIDFRLK